LSGIRNGNTAFDKEGLIIRAQIQIPQGDGECTTGIQTPASHNNIVIRASTGIVEGEMK
jgi:hypothetical protein